ncbi:hypothetical protein PM082_008785 [Marasmius tenuissimus]|nr:hypothetical protein PM082_008785 [Marasmius tenuissimus]
MKEAPYYKQTGRIVRMRDGCSDDDNGRKEETELKLKKEKYKETMQTQPPHVSAKKTTISIGGTYNPPTASSPATSGRRTLRFRKRELLTTISANDKTSTFMEFPNHLVDDDPKLVTIVQISESGEVCGSERVGWEPCQERENFGGL